MRWTRDGQRFVHPSADATRFVRELFRQYGERSSDLEVRRTSLRTPTWRWSGVRAGRGEPAPGEEARPRSTDRLIAARLGLARGRIELRQTLTNPPDLCRLLFFRAGPAARHAVLHARRTVPGTDFSLGACTLPGVLGMGIAFGGLVTMAQQLIVDREDGTLLRAKATPNGMSAT